MIEQAAGVIFSFVQSAVQEAFKGFAQDRLDERALERLYGELDAAIERQCSGGAEAEAVRDAADKLTYAYTDPQVLTDDWHAELTERFYREHPDIRRSERLDHLFTDCYARLDRYLSAQLGQKGRLSLLANRQDGKENARLVIDRIDRTENNLKLLLQSGRRFPMLCVCKDRPVLCEVWDSAFDGIDLFSGDTLFFTESVGEDTRKLTLSLVNPGQVPITELTLSDFMVGVVTDVQYENGYYESTQIFQNVDGQSVRNIIFPGQRFDLSMVFDDELGEDREKPGYLYVSFAASALCVEGEEPARYRYDLFCDRQEARGESAPFYTGSYRICVLRQS